MIGGFNKLHNLPPAILWSVLAVVIVGVGVGVYLLFIGVAPIVEEKAVVDYKALMEGDSIEKIVYKHYDQDKNIISKIHFLGLPLASDLNLNNAWIVPGSIIVNDDKTITYIEDISPYAKPDEKNLLTVNYLDKTVKKKVNLFNPENASRIGELDKEMYVLTDRDAGIIYLVNPSTFDRQKIKLPNPISSSYWTSDLKEILFTQDEALEAGETNIYSMDINSEIITRFTASDNDQVSVEFSPYAKVDTKNPLCRRGEYNKTQQYWSNYHKYFSPNGGKLAIDKCGDGIFILDLNSKVVKNLYDDERAFLLGWLSEENILARVENDSGDYRIISVDTSSGEERRIVPEMFFWDIRWVVSPDYGKIVYAASSTDLSNFKAGNTFLNNSIQTKADIYIVDLQLNTRTQIFSNFPLDHLSGSLSIGWSPDSDGILIQSGGTGKCNIYNLADSRIEIVEPCMDASWLK